MSSLFCLLVYKYTSLLLKLVFFWPIVSAMLLRSDLTHHTLFVQLTYKLAYSKLRKAYVKERKHTHKDFYNKQ